MREIKFRAWVSSMKKMHTWGVNLISINHDLSWESLSDGMFDVNDSFLMQFTGLEDKKGKEIYEGDILKCDWCFRKMPSRGYLNKKNPTAILGYSVVEFDRGEFSFKFLKPIPEHEEVYNKNKRQYAYIGYTRDAYNRKQVHVEVVGNIYETPNLMSGRHEA